MSMPLREKSCVSTPLRPFVSFGATVGPVRLLTRALALPHCLKEDDVYKGVHFDGRYQCLSALNDT